MLKYIIIVLISLTSASNARHIKIPPKSVYSYSNPYDYMMDKNLEKATGPEGQMSLEDYKKSIDALPRSERKKFKNKNKDFDKMDYNKNGYVSGDEYKRYNLENEINRPKTKSEERRAKKQQRDGTYVDPRIQYDSITKDLDEKIEKEKEEALKAQEEALKAQEEKDIEVEND